MDDDIGGSIAVQLLHRFHLHEIVVFAAGDEDVSAAFRPELLHDKRTEKAGSP